MMFFIILFKLLQTFLPFIFYFPSRSDSILYFAKVNLELRAFILLISLGKRGICNLSKSKKKKKSKRGVCNTIHDMKLEGRSL